MNKVRLSNDGMTSRLEKILLNHYDKAIREDTENFIYVMDTEDVKRWFILVCNMDDPYKFGEYIFTCWVEERSGRTFPFIPPSLGCLTPNGVFDPNGGKICTSIGEFHSNVPSNARDKEYALGWRPALGIHGFAQLVTCGIMLADDVTDLKGIRIVKTSERTKRKLALRSRDYNSSKRPRIAALFESFIEDNPGLKAVKLIRANREAKPTEEK